MSISMAPVQNLGRALMLPIAVLPIAALLLRLGQADLLNIPFISTAGEAIFTHLGMLFAIGVAVGFARNENGAAALAGLVCYLVATKGAEVFIEAPPDYLAAYADNAKDMAIASFKQQTIQKMSVPIGIVSGLISGNLYNRYSTFKLPEFLAFFGGKRFVSIVCGFAGLILALVFGLGWEFIERGIDGFSRYIIELGALGVFLFGVLNRLLIVTGLHHILNNVAYFIVGDFEGTTGDLLRFFAGDPTAGAFMTGFFPVMMFGLPAACLAMYHEARPERRKAVGGILLSMALTSHLTGVTEPIEFAFMFLAPVLFALHAVLTGISMAVMDLMNVRLGYGFSAGLFDFILNFNKGTNAWLIVPFGLVYFMIYYLTFRYAIRKFDLKTLGRDKLSTQAPARQGETASDIGSDFIVALGGAANLKSVIACTTRLRLEIDDKTKINEDALLALGAKGVIYPSAHTAQVIIGPQADFIADSINSNLSTQPAVHQAVRDLNNEAQTPWKPADIDLIVQALGGKSNISDFFVRHNRLCVKLRRHMPDAIVSFVQLGAQAGTYISNTDLHVLWEQSLDDLEAVLNKQIHAQTS